MNSEREFLTHIIFRHMPQFERPGEFNEVVGTFLRNGSYLKQIAAIDTFKIDYRAMILIS